MRFLVDMCVDIRVAEWLRSSGHDAVHLRDESLQRLPNGEIFIKADKEHWAIVTFDLDFSEIAAFSHGQKVSVIVFRLRNTRARHVIERLGVILPHVLEALDSGAIIMVEESQYRIRYLPIGRSEGH